MISRRSLSLFGLPLLLALVTPGLARDVTHVMGVTSVPDQPLRVVALTNEATEDLLALGIVPVGAVRSANADPWFDHVAEPLKDTVLVGEELAPDLEVILSLEPDLILGNKKRHEQIYEPLSAIAPTVFVENITGQWRQNLAFYAGAVGRAAEGDALLKAYEARVAAIRAALGARIEEKVGLVRFISGQNYAYSNDSFSGSILRDVGFARPAAQDKPGLANPSVSNAFPNSMATGCSISAMKPAMAARPRKRKPGWRRRSGSILQRPRPGMSMAYPTPSGQRPAASWRRIWRSTISKESTIYPRRADGGGGSPF